MSAALFRDDLHQQMEELEQECNGLKMELARRDVEESDQAVAETERETEQKAREGDLKTLVLSQERELDLVREELDGAEQAMLALKVDKAQLETEVVLRHPEEQQCILLFV